MIAVQATNLEKIYLIYQHPVARVKEIVFRKLGHERFSALSDINFAIMHGGTLGIIGENGSGKSTLLKLVAGVIQPTSGSLKIYGRVAALLELGAGFNPELSGEDNIYLNAFLMGLTRQEVAEKKQAIIDFSELGSFIHRPIKTYSSGMVVRLAFSIATAVDPDILIIDEALSVGDDYFQRKCIERILRFKRSGKTIIFCSHSMYHVHELCDEVLWLHKGEIRGKGESKKIIGAYENFERERNLTEKPGWQGPVRNQEDNDTLSLPVASQHAGTAKPLKVVDIQILNDRGEEVDIVKPLTSVTFSFRVRCSEVGLTGHFGFILKRNDEVWTFGTATHFDGLPPITFTDRQRCAIRIPALPLLQGKYAILAGATDASGLHIYDQAQSAPFIVEGDRREVGMVFMNHEWQL